MYYIIRSVVFGTVAPPDEALELAGDALSIDMHYATVVDVTKLGSESQAYLPGSILHKLVQMLGEPIDVTASVIAQGETPGKLLGKARACGFPRT